MTSRTDIAYVKSTPLHDRLSENQGATKNEKSRPAA